MRKTEIQKQNSLRQPQNDFFVHIAKFYIFFNAKLPLLLFFKKKTVNCFYGRLFLNCYFHRSEQKNLKNVKFEVQIKINVQ